MCELVTFDELKTRLKLKEYPLLSDYPDLESIKTSVEQAIKSYLSSEICYGTYVERVTTSVYASNLISLHGLPIKSLTSISAIAGSYQSDLDVSEVEDVSNFSVRYGWLESKIEIPSLQIDVTYIGGFETIPDALHRAALVQTMWEYQTKHDLGSTKKSTVGVQGTTSIDRPEFGLLTEVKRLLSDYINPSKSSILGQKQIISFVEIP